MTERVADYLSLIPIFSALLPEELRVVEEHVSALRVEPGEFVYREGEKGDSVCFIAAGSLDVIKFNQNAQPVVIGTLGKGNSIGEVALLDRLTRSASVRARNSSSLIMLTHDSFERLLAEHPDIGVKVLKGIALLMSTNLRRTSDKLAEYMPSLG